VRGRGERRVSTELTQAGYNTSTLVIKTS